MKKQIVITLSILLGVLAAGQADAQSVSGVVFENNGTAAKTPLIGVNVYWIGTTKGTFTDGKGKFQISRQGIKDSRLIISLLGIKKIPSELGMAKATSKFSWVPINSNWASWRSRRHRIHSCQS